MLKLYIVRHGETEFNIQKRMQGRIDSPLTQRGIEHAMALGKHLKDIEFEKVLCSPSPRAYRTAELIIGERKKPIETEDDLREMNLADWEGKTKEEIEKKYPEANDIFWNSPQLFRPEEGESFYEVQDRAIAIIKRLVENEEGNTLIVTHSVVIKTIVAHFMKYTMDNLWAPPLIHDTSVTLLRAEKGDAKLEVIGDVSHIS